MASFQWAAERFFIIVRNSAVVLGSGEGPAVIETIPDQARKLGGDAFAGRFFHEAMQGADLGKSLCQTRPDAQTQRGCAAGSAQKGSAIHDAQYRAHMQASP